MAKRLLEIKHTVAGTAEHYPPLAADVIAAFEGRYDEVLGQGYEANGLQVVDPDWKKEAKEKGPSPPDATAQPARPLAGL